ncbi:MAG TPA: type II toxin-antitoxin system PemK/MazF family toxin [Candidatus Ozemobacteraceae bacterium]|nr:type II toxin-antitoxin system PemK/MazF family toxin [Candidatus Ozemobacteraceae bacterium]
MVMEIKRFDVFLVSFDPSVGSEIRKSRPAVIISPDEMNRHLKTVIVAPLTSTMKKYPSRVEVHFENVQGEIALDQIRTIDKTRLKKRLAKIDERITERICEILTRMFSK